MKTTMKVTKVILARIWWLGRGMATMMGIAMMFALTVGLASSALAGTGIGASLDLGEVNVVDNVTTQLVGKVAGPTFTVVNNHDGKVANNEQRAAAPPPPGEPPIPDPTITVPAPALGLSVSPGQTPLTVNPEAGTARDLSADELDGKDSSQFLASSGKANDAERLDGLDSSSYLKTSGKASDADRLDGKDGSAFVSDIYLMQSSKQGNGGGSGEVRQAFCDLGDRVLGGGGGSTANPVQDYKDVVIKSQAQIEGPNDESWFVQVRDNGAPSLITAQAICADFTPDN